MGKKLQLLIVDDDFQIREGIRCAFEWENLGIDHVETASNGLAALESIQKDMPDLILADIQMPGMTGLELVQKIREQETDTRIILISAYSEFEYCREALRLRANDYILKPVRFRELENTLLKNIAALQASREEKEQQKAVALEQEIHALYEERNKADGSDLLHLLGEEYPFLRNSALLTIVIQPVGLPAGQEDTWYTATEQLGAFMKKKMEAAIIPPRKDYLILFVKGSHSALEINQTQNRARILLEQGLKELDTAPFKVVAGISGIHEAKGMQDAFLRAKDATVNYFYCPSRSVFLSEEIRVTETLLPQKAQKCEKIIQLCCMQQLNRLEIKQQMAEMKTILADSMVREIPLKKQLVQAIWGCGKTESAAFKDLVYEQTDTLDELIMVLERYFIGMQSNLKEEESRASLSRGVALAVEYIKVHGFGPLGVPEVAEAAGMSPNRFSSVFKKEMGMSMTEFLTKVRMEEARRLAIKTNMKVNEICEATGFSGYMYFSRVFRDTYGCSVSEMREHPEKYMDIESF